MTSQRTITLSLGILLLIALGGNIFLLTLQQNENDLIFRKIRALENQNGSVTLPEEENEDGDDTDDQPIREVIEQRVVEESSVIDTVEAVRPSVVSVIERRQLPQFRSRNRLFYDPFFGPFMMPERNGGQREPVEVGGGSGFVYSQDGLILTNRHVVENSDSEFSVVFYNGTEEEAEVVAMDDRQDVAILRLTTDDEQVLNNLQPLELGNSNDIQVGQRVIAIGNALAEFRNTVTSGIISGLDRSIMARGHSGGEEIQNLIQTDAAINPGNSGGPLVGLNNKVVGMNTAVAAGADGIGFAIPVNDLRMIAESYEEYGRIVRPFIGIQYIPLSSDIAEELEIDIENGAYILRNDYYSDPAIVPNSPAEEAGLQEEDIIIAIDGFEITQMRSLPEILTGKKPGDTITLTVLRNGDEREIDLDLGEMQ
jgi:serine protease Do